MGQCHHLQLARSADYFIVVNQSHLGTFHLVTQVDTSVVLSLLLI